MVEGYAWLEKRPRKPMFWGGGPSQETFFSFPMDTNSELTELTPPKFYMLLHQSNTSAYPALAARASDACATACIVSLANSSPLGMSFSDLFSSFDNPFSGSKT